MTGQVPSPCQGRTACQLWGPPPTDLPGLQGECGGSKEAPRPEVSFEGKQVLGCGGRREHSVFRAEPGQHGGAQGAWGSGEASPEHHGLAFHPMSHGSSKGPQQKSNVVTLTL